MVQLKDYLHSRTSLSMVMTRSLASLPPIFFVAGLPSCISFKLTLVRIFNQIISLHMVLYNIVQIVDLALKTEQALALLVMLRWSWSDHFILRAT